MMNSSDFQTQPPPPPYAGPRNFPMQPPGWFRRNRVWFIPTLILSILLLIVSFIGGMIVLLFGFIRSAEPTQHAIQVAEHDPRVQQALGAPVKAGRFVSGSVYVSGSTGNADVAVPAQGSAHHGTIHAVAKKSDGDWNYETLELEIDGQGERVNLLPEPQTSQR